MAASAAGDSLTHAVAGAAGGVFSTCLTYPLGTVSSRLAVQKDAPGAGRTYAGTLDAFRKIYFREGLPGLYAGLQTAVVGIAVTNGVYYYWYESVKAWLLTPSSGSSRSSNLTTAQTMLAGAIAGAATTVITNPIWVINMRMTVQRDAGVTSKNKAESHERECDQSKESCSDKAEKGLVRNGKCKRKTQSTFAVLMQTIREDGVLSLWQGVMPALVLVSNPIIQYTVFEQLKWRVEKVLLNDTRKHLGSAHFFVLGAVAKLCATSITFPYIVIKARMQLRQNTADEATRYRSIGDAFRKILQHEGVPGLYKGLGSKLMQSVLAAAILFSAKESFFRFAVTTLQLISPAAKPAVTTARR